MSQREVVAHKIPDKERDPPRSPPTNPEPDRKRDHEIVPSVDPLVEDWPNVIEPDGPWERK